MLKKEPLYSVRLLKTTFKIICLKYNFKHIILTVRNLYHINQREYQIRPNALYNIKINK